MTDVQLRKDHIRLLDNELHLHAPDEACGVLIGRKEHSSIIVEIVLPIKNSRLSDRSFELDPKEYYDAWKRAEEEGMEIVGVYHTHPHSKASPSAWDEESMENYQTLWIIVGVDGIHGFEWDGGVGPVEVIKVT
ncbi:MAG: M67 family metallopeptidase [ANME-2 cluster archaeon]|nr:M67 family metallopeptidase [ANME-2 cluster archaeon]